MIFTILIYISYTCLSIANTANLISKINSSENLNLIKVKIKTQKLEYKIESTKFVTEGHLTLSRLYDQLSEIENREEYSDKAKKEIIKGIKKTPTKPVLWAYLCFLEKDEIEKLNINIKKALEFGKYEETTQRILIPIILEKWDQLNKENKRQSEIMLRHTLKYFKNGLVTLKYAAKLKKDKIIQAMMNEDWHWHRLKKFNDEQNRNK